ncbi:YopX family protein [Clostridium aestuarii]|uniref:YopX family protein n=1 Tax=Clostridium aestuarii TaxID=338193 RepID=A0ABT4D4T8_9CLOT|nr:YopX family protein [Clostridium aestuarii]MCY6485647.1 YopX family protein [Clostridium aestuarii]
MREFKFRTWDKQKKKMIQFEDMKSWTFNIFEDDKYVIMQYIGSKDINGKEIYEGDILETGNDAGVVEYGGGSFMYNCAKLIITGDEVLGNIYENPELLKEKNIEF